MSRLRRFDIVEHRHQAHHQLTPSYFLKQTSILDSRNPWFPILEQDLDLDLELELDLFTLAPPTPLFLDDFDAAADLIQIHRASARRRSPELYLQALSDRVSALELGFDRLSKEEEREKERKYTWTAEIKSPGDERKYKWTAEKKGPARSYKVTTEIKRRGEAEQTYTFKVSSGEEEKNKVEKKKKCEKAKEKEKSVGARFVEIEEPSDHGGIVLRQVFAKRVDKRRGKRKELSPQDAAALIQKTFRAYLIQRSQALRALRELAIAKTKLKEIRALFNSFSYRRRLTRDAEERQRFSEKIIVLLLTVDAIEGADLMVRAAKKSMEDELEAMLDVVDPQPPGRSSSIKRRTFDMPDGVMKKELAAGVAQVVRMLDQEGAGSEAFEACL